MANSKNELAYDKIKDLFNSGAIKPGDKFSAYELSKQLGISRTPITSALKRLEHEKLVEILPQIGAPSGILMDKSPENIFSFELY